MRHRPSFTARAAADYPFWTLCVLVVAVFLMGGGAREDITSLILLRPLAALCLVIGVAGLKREEVRRFRVPLAFMASLLLLIVLHLIPLPPSVWTALPGREIAVDVGQVAGIGQPWRPLTLVPWRGWNALYAMLVPAAAMVLAIRCRPEQRQTLLTLILVVGLVSVLVGIAQAVSGFRPGLYFYSISSAGTPNGLFANRNHQAALIACLVPMLAYFASRRAPGRVTRIRAAAAIAAAALCLLVLLTTGSRAGLVLAVVALPTASLLLRSREGKSGWRRMMYIAAAAAGVLLITVVALLGSRAVAIDRILETGGWDDLRIEYWSVVARLIGEYFPVGSGIGSFVEVYKIDEPHALLGPSYLNHAHNDWLEWTLEAGLPGIVLMLLAVLSWTRRTIVVVQKLDHYRDQASLALVGAIIILLLGLASFVDYPLRVPSIATLAAIAAVWMWYPVSWNRSPTREESTRRRRKESSVPEPLLG